MTVVVACKCGRRFAANESCLGQEVSCPGCGSRLKIATSPEASAELYVECRCGRAFWAPKELRGKRSPCPACGALLSVGDFKSPSQPAVVFSAASEAGSGPYPALSSVSSDDDDIPWGSLKLIG